MTTKKQQREDERTDAINELRRILPPGSTAFTILRHVSASGMSRDISVKAIDPTHDFDGGLRDITHLVARATDRTVRESHGHWAIREPGAGMDMGFHIVYGLSATLYGHDNRGGYAVKHRWL